MKKQNTSMIQNPRQPAGTLRWRLGALALALLMIFLGALGGSMLVQQQTANAQESGLQLVSLYEDQAALADLYEAVAPSVVNIRVVGDGDGTLTPFGLPDAPQQGQGSGFIYDNEGHIVTNNHVIEDADEITVIFNNGFWADAELVSADPQADLAVIKVTPPQNYVWQPLPLAADEALRVGHAVIAIGNPFGLDGTMTTGIVSAVKRGLPIGELGSARYTLPEVIQTDAAINPGNSGGPLLNLNGEVVGVNFAIESPVRGNSGVGFAIPVSIVERVVPALIEDGRYEYAYLGLSGQSISPELAEALALEDNMLGVYVSAVVAGGPSEEGGLQGGDEVIETEDGLEISTGGDIVTAIDGETVRRFEDLVGYLVTKTTPGQVVVLSVMRDGSLQEIQVKLGNRPVTSAALRPGREEGEVNAREAIQIAIEAVEGTDILDGEITEKVATPDTVDGVDVWQVELSTAKATAVVMVEKATGDVIDISVE